MTDTPLSEQLDSALARLEQAVAARLEAAALRAAPADAGEAPVAVPPGEVEELRRRLAASEAEVQRLTRALAVAEKRRADALAKLDSAVGQVDLFLSQPEVR